MVLGFGISLNETMITIHNVALFSISRSLHGYHSITFHDLFNFLSRLLTQMQFDDFLNTLHIYYSTCIGTHVRIQKIVAPSVTSLIFSTLKKVNLP